MSMDCDTRLSMMTLRERTPHSSASRRNSRMRKVSTSTVAVMAAFALTLFTRTA